MTQIKDKSSSNLWSLNPPRFTARALSTSDIQVKVVGIGSIDDAPGFTTMNASRLRRKLS